MILSGDASCKRVPHLTVCTRLLELLGATVQSSLMLEQYIIEYLLLFLGRIELGSNVSNRDALR